MLVRVSALLVLLLAGCASGGTPLRDAELSDESVVLDVPVALQGGRFDCGVTALSMLLAYYGVPSDATRAEALRDKAEDEQGLTGADLEEYLISEGFETALFEGALDDSVGGLYHHLDRGRPIVAAMRVGGGNHFVLVTGYDPANEWILLHDPQRGAQVFPAGQFEHAWDGAGRFTLLATPGG